MAVERYTYDFGSANAGGTPTFLFFRRLDTNADLPQPPISEIGFGVYYHDYDFDTAPAGVSEIEFKVTWNGVEVSGLMSGTPAPGTLIPGPLVGGNFKTAATLISRAAIQLGLGPVGDAFGSTDPNIIQLREFLNTAGDDLGREYDWTHLVKEFTFTTTAGQASQALPGDFDSMIDDTGWNESAQTPFVGPVTRQVSQFVKVRVAGIPLNVIFQQAGNSLIFPLAPPTGANCSLLYLSNFWVASSGATTPDKEEATANDDVVWYDPLLVVRALKVSWLTVKGKDTTVAVEEYEKTLEHCVGKNTGGQVLSLNGRTLPYDRLLDGNNLPITGWGVP